MQNRFSQAKRAKNRGAVMGLAVCAVFLIVIVLIRNTMLTLTLGLFVALFIALIISSIVRYNSSLEHLKADRPNLEEDVDLCQDQAAGKYFFLNDCLVDLASAKIYYYEEIASVKATRVSGRRSAQTVSQTGYFVEIRMKSGGSHIIADFQNSCAKSQSESDGNYARFIELLRAFVPEALEADGGS